MEDIKTFDKKQRDYGSGNIGDFGEYGVLVRVNDKIQRLKNLQKRIGRNIGMTESVEPTNENISDTWLDLSVYSIIARMCRDGAWPKGGE